MILGKPVEDSVNHSIQFYLHRLTSDTLWLSVSNEIYVSISHSVYISVRELVPNPINIII